MVNKVDSSLKENDAAEFYALGMGDYFTISATNGSGTGELLDELVKDFSEDKIPDPEDLPKLAVIGRPNVGKSSIVNALYGEERNIVTDIAGTTRDTVNTHFNKFDMNFLILQLFHFALFDSIAVPFCIL